MNEAAAKALYAVGARPPSAARELHRLEGEHEALRTKMAADAKREQEMRREILRRRLDMTPNEARLYETMRYVFCQRGVAGGGMPASDVGARGRTTDDSQVRPQRAEP